LTDLFRIFIENNKIHIETPNIIVFFLS